FYLCGYAVELALKARICKTLKWTIFPSNRKAFATFYVHDLDVLLNMTGRETAIKQALFAEWSFVAAKWNSELRYEQLGSKSRQDLLDMIRSAELLVRELL